MKNTGPFVLSASSKLTVFSVTQSPLSSHTVLVIGIDTDYGTLIYVNPNFPTINMYTSTLSINPADNTYLIYSGEQSIKSFSNPPSSSVEDAIFNNPRPGLYAKYNKYVAFFGLPNDYIDRLPQTQCYKKCTVQNDITPLWPSTVDNALEYNKMLSILKNY